MIQSTDIDRCPKHSMSARHYREDGSCRCDERAATIERIRELGEQIAPLRAERRKLRDDLRDAL